MTGRESADPLGTLQAEVEIKAGELTYTAFDGSPFRWGDYSGMTIDPDGETFWYLGEYSKDTGTAVGRWGTYIGSASFAACSSTCSVGDNDLTISNTTDNGTVAYQACNSIHFGPHYEVGATGNVTAQAPTVSLGNDVSIRGTFTVDTSVP